ncbi:MULTISPECIES: caspase family protein [unclassified Microcoleus]|uniref:caspase family protein n=1 Tax=unclassified Microcoleus TaxID=2642155 RepID=UPI002FD6B954
MTDKSEQTPNIYALLIGIDGYKPNRFYKNLKGCVRDINLVASYLLKTLNIPSERIFKLTSPNPEVAETIETKDPEPTYENIVAKFDAITEIAKQGEQVYIHYSGHGGRAATIYPQLRGQGQFDEALVPMDIGEDKSRYLRDLEFITLLKRMTDKGLVVTVVLDSCHSGGETRGEYSDIRGGDSDDNSQRRTDSLVASEEELIRNWGLTGGTARNATPGGWFPQLSEYVVLAACRPSELAYEYAFNGTERQGALTYWLLDTLANRSSELTYQLLYDRIYAKVQGQFQTQSPMLFGEGNRQVFGSDRTEYHYTVHVIKVDPAEKRVLLDAGRAQGIGKGAQFAIYPLGTTDFNQKELAIVEVTEDITVVNAWAVIEPDSLPVGSKVEAGAPAVMLAAPIELIQRVRLFFKQEDTGDRKLPPNQVLPPEILKIQAEALAAIKSAIPHVGKGWVELVSEGQAEQYQVAITKDGEYEICDPSGEPFENLRPHLKVNEPNAPEKVVKRLIHLAKYQAAEVLKNTSALTNKLIVQLADENKNPLADPTTQTLKEAERTYLHIKNDSPQDLSVVVLDFQSNWAIDQLDIFGDGAEFATFSPGAEELIPIKFSLPNGYKEGQDILKVFAVANKSAKFHWLKLPPLDAPIEPKSAVEKGEQEAARNSTNPLDKLLAAISADVDNELSLRAVQVDDPNRGWMTKSVTVTVTR